MKSEDRSQKSEVRSMKRQIELFFAALMFYTRIPCPKKVDCSNVDLNQASRYYPLAGIIVGAISFLIY